mmetsp:Transcript_51678/g.129680  ORF Transcript_51678/g.129680 Transcript_51678/m.129680 type:complete len:368 (-) Transcript_51678:46-1149(-)|eukprot:CAMPEP_0174238736 /NCGR_PEP_ID=MMETSP0417-20130205/12265_1 /TAXON_ID=242541 /ORGANISM="Mayorella sp, Strain BSH-02190019" /LENGTH=367 /DNA_ID=CAMNT_0015317609 /DNA_START=54 /DNA_END=1157 /DNA_ORIENTATION=+
MSSSSPEESTVAEASSESPEESATVEKSPETTSTSCPLTHALLKEYTVSELLPSSFSLVQVQSTDQFTSALRTLFDANILAAPVYDAAKAEYVGMVDRLDLLLYSVMVFGERNMYAKDFQRLVQSSGAAENGDDHAASSDTALDSSDFTMSQLKDFSLRDKWFPLSHKAPLQMLVNLFSTYVHLHRVPLIDRETDQVCGLVSQFRLLSFLHAKRELLNPDGLSQPIGEWALKKVICVDHKEATVKAYSTLLAKDVSGVAVTDDDGRLVGCLSASDLRGSAPGRLFQEFHLPVRKFLENSQMARCGKITTELETCRLGEPLGTVLERLVDAHVHRMFVVDDEHKPIGVISLSDFIRQLRHSLSPSSTE